MITLTTGILGYVSQNKQRKKLSVYIFLTIKASYDIRPYIYEIQDCIPPDDDLIVQNIYREIFLLFIL